MKSIISIAVLFFLFGCDILESKTGYIDGAVFNRETHYSIENARIYTIPPTQAVLSNSEGSFKIHNAEKGIYIVIAEKSGFINDTVQVSVLSNEVTTTFMLLAPDTSSN